MLRCGSELRPWPVPDTQEKLTRSAWAADLIEDYDALTPRLRAFLTDDENAEVDAFLWSIAHPHPLGIDREDGGSCNSCDASFDSGELAMVLKGDDSTEGAWCYACVAIVVEAIKAARTS